MGTRNDALFYYGAEESIREISWYDQKFSFHMDIHPQGCDEAVSVSIAGLIGCESEDLNSPPTKCPSLFDFMIANRHGFETGNAASSGLNTECRRSLTPEQYGPGSDHIIDTN